MPVLAYAAIANLAQDRAQVNVSTDAPFDAATLARYINDAYADVYEISGGRIKKVASATAWTTANLATGVVAGILTDIKEIRTLFASTVSGSTGFSSGDKALDPVDISQIQFLRSADGLPTYSVPKVYALLPLATDTAADVGKMELHYWPSVTGFYFPTHYVRTFTEIDSATVTTPDVTDIESRDIGLMAGMRLAQGAGRSDLVPGILMDISERTAKAMERKLRAMISGDQDA